MSYLYVNEQGAKIGVSGGYFLITQKDGMERKIPKETLESVVLFGNVQMSTQFIGEVLQMGIPVSLFSARGKYFGRLESTMFSNIDTIKSQMLLLEDEVLILEMSKKVLMAKVHNQKVLLQRYNRDRNIITTHEINHLDQMEKHIDTGTSIEQIMGYEGSAARVYFTGLGNLVPKEFRFSGRTRRPPKDPFNSLLSLGYTLLMYEIYGDITSRGLNPYGGFLHKDKRSHPTLASDLMEEWRPAIVDSLVMSLMTRREMNQEHFNQDDENGAVYISNSGMRIFLSKFEKKLRTDIKYREDKSSMSFRKAIWSQTGDLLKVFQHKDADYYQGLRIR